MRDLCCSVLCAKDMSTASVTIIKNIQSYLAEYASQDNLKGYEVTTGFTSLVTVLHWSHACLAQYRASGGHISIKAELEAATPEIVRSIAKPVNFFITFDKNGFVFKSRKKKFFSICPHSLSTLMCFVCL